MRLRLFESAAKAKDGEKMLRYSRRGLVRFSNWGGELQQNTHLQL
jgi:hypothetical protein